MICEKKPFGVTKDGREVTAFTLKNGAVSAVILDYGCTIQSLIVPDKNGKPVDVVLGYDTVKGYEDGDGYLGAAIGRVGNRIAKGKFTLNGKDYTLAVNNGPNHLHGGLVGFDSVIWDAKVSEDALAFTRLSPDGEEGYPGNLLVTITYRLLDNALEITYDAKTDAPTLINLTNHSYFNLNGGGSVLDHVLQVNADRFCEGDPDCLPTGKLLAVAGTPFDFNEPKKIGRDIGMDDIQLKNGGGYDHNFCLSDPAEIKKAAVLASEETGIEMTTTTTLPGMQVYSANFLTEREGKGGVSIGYRYALCLETQRYPDAIHNPDFPCVVLTPEKDYHEVTTYTFCAK
ncbi:MAG: galactose mutarotase [Clostridia bacterium]|nr:galactose mutarotase [Clostridia bacterium]